MKKICLSFFFLLLISAVFLAADKTSAGENKEDTLSQFLQGNKGKIIILNYWATWCDTCLEELAELSDFTAAHPQIKVAAVNATHTERSKQAVENFIKKSSLPFPVFLDQNGETAEIYRQKIVPFTVIIDEAGNTETIIAGPVTRVVLEQKLSEFQKSS